MRRHYLVVFCARSTRGDVVGNIECILEGPLNYDAVKAFTSTVQEAHPDVREIAITNIVSLEG